MASKRSSMKKFRTRMFLFVPVCFSLVVILTVSIGRYWLEIIDKYQENETLSIKLEKLKEKEAALAVDVEKLQDSEYIARYAREKYLFTKEGEIVFKLPE